MITRGDVERTKEWVDEAVNHGAQLRFGGNSEGGIFQPTVLVNVPASEKVSCEEVFAPVVHINTFTEFEEAITLVNDSKFGLQAGIFTNDIHKALRAAKNLRLAES